MNKKAILLVVLAGLLWGSSGIFFNLLRPFGFTPLQMTAARGTMAALAVTAYALIRDRRLFRVELRHVLLILGSGLCMFGAAAAYYSAIDFSSVSTAVILMYTSPVFVMAYSVAFLGEKLNPLKVLSVALVLAGCALVSGIIGGMKFSLWGVVLGLAAGVIYSGYNVIAKIQMMKGLHSLSVTIYNVWIMGGAAVCVCDPVGLVGIAAQKPAATVPLMIGLGICTCVLPYFLFTYALQELPAGTSAALGVVEPLAATVYAALFFGQIPDLPGWIGMVLIIGAVLLLSVSEKEKKTNE